MSKGSNIYLWSLILVVVAGSMFLSNLGILHFKLQYMVSLVLVVYGIAQTYNYFGKYKPINLFASAFTFYIGVLIFIFTKHKYLFSSEVVVPAILISGALSFMVVFYDDRSQKQYLYYTIISIVVSVLWFIVNPFERFVPWLGQIISSPLDVIPIVLIIIAILLVVDRNHSKDDY